MMMTRRGHSLGDLMYLASTPGRTAPTFDEFDVPPFDPIPITMVISAGIPLPGQLFRSGEDGGPPILAAETTSDLLFDAEGLVGPKSTPLYLDHHADWAIGVVERVAAVRGRLLARGLLIDCPQGRYLLGSYGIGAVWRPSIGVTMTATLSEFVEEGRVVVVNGRDFGGPLEIVRAWRLKEVSLTTSAADEGASLVLGAI